MTNFQGPPRPKTPTHSKITSSPKHKIPYQNPWILYKNLKNTNLSQITRNPHENTQITPNTTKPLKSHQRLPNIVRLPQLIPKYLGRARPSQNRRACDIWVVHAIQKERSLQEKQNYAMINTRPTKCQIKCVTELFAKWHHVCQFAGITPLD